MVMRVDGHVDVPLVGFEELEVEAGDKGRNTHIEFCVRETVGGERVLESF